MNKYEALYIIRTDIEEQAIKDLIEKFAGVITANGGSIDSTDEWGKRRLAYPIDYKTEGYYVLVKFQAESAVPAELERNFKINDGIMRYMVTKLEA
jgi:small subunit ribosomal protein S6